MRRLAFIVLFCSLVCARANATTYFAIRSVIDANGLQTPITALLRTILVERFKHHAEVTLEVPPEKDHASGYETTLRVHSIKRHVRVQAGRRYLEVEVAVHLIGVTRPENALVSASEGRASMTIPIGFAADVNRLSQKMFPEVANAAVEEAVNATVSKMSLIAAR